MKERMCFVKLKGKHFVKYLWNPTALLWLLAADARVFMKT